MNGKKTYILVIAAVVAVIAQFIAAGDWSFAAVLEFLKSEAALGAIAALRHGVAKSGNAQ